MPLRPLSSRRASLSLPVVAAALVTVAVLSAQTACDSFAPCNPSSRNTGEAILASWCALGGRACRCSSEDRSLAGDDSADEGAQAAVHQARARPMRPVVYDAAPPLRANS